MAEETNNTSETAAKTKTPFISVEKIKPDLRKKELPMVDVKVTNPITYLKSWWKRVIGNEGIELRLRIKPLTAIVLTVVILSLWLGIGRIVLPFQIPFFEITSQEASPTPLPFRETAYAGILRFSDGNKRYYLETNSSEAINLNVPKNIILEEFIGRRVFAVGMYNDKDRLLEVVDVANIEIFPEVVEPIPTLTAAPTSMPVPTVLPTPSPNQEDIATSSAE